MSKLQMLRPLTAAVEASRSQQNDHQHKQLRAAFNPEVRLHRADIQQLLVQHEWSPSFDEEEADPQQIKEEQKDLWTGEEGEQLRGVEEAEITKVPVKSEDNEREVQSNQLHQNQTEENTEAELLPISPVEQIKTEADGEDRRGPDPTRNFDPVLHADIQQLDQGEPKPPHIKEEWEELWISQEGEQLHGLQEADYTKFTFTFMPVKSENNEAKVQSSQLHQCKTGENTEAELLASTSSEKIKTEADGEDCRGPEPTKNSHPDIQQLLQQEWSPCLDQEEPMPIIKFPSALVSVKKDDDEANIQTSHLHQSQTEENIEAGHRSSNSVERIKAEAGGEDCRRPSVCGKTFTQNENLKVHMRIQTGEKPFCCSDCGKTFAQSEYLKVHMIIHTQVTPFICSICGKTFAQNVDLKVHMRIHAGEKPFICSVCGKTFAQSGGLKVHMRIHTGEKPFSCSVCGNTFARSGTLKGHMKIHTGEKPFSCSVCGKTFARCGTLNVHMRTHRGEKPTL